MLGMIRLVAGSSFAETVRNYRQPHTSTPVRIIPLPVNSVRPGRPLPFALRDAHGQLLLARGQCVDSQAQLEALQARGLWVDEQESEAYRKEFAQALDSMVRQDSLLGEIAKAKPDIRVATDLLKPAAPAVADWPDLHMRANTLLRDPRPEDFITRLERLRVDVLWHLETDADRSLLSLIHHASVDIQHYSASHALLAMVVCHLAFQQLNWPAEWQRPLELAALSMNVSTTALQDLLAEQTELVTEPQRTRINEHAQTSVQLLQSMGVQEPLWLDAVLFHHTHVPGPLAARTPGQQLARLIQRADVFGSRLSPRRNRKAQAASAAAQAAYLDENKQADEAGAAIVKALGIYPPGCLVRLANGEVAVVLKRGRAANAPLVASVIGKGGTPLGEPAVRDTRLQSQAVTGSVAPHELRMRLNLERLSRLG
jgi:HD-GYP domain-containing protein (c-di-GMP phosphodiesterase class II)